MCGPVTPRAHPLTTRDPSRGEARAPGPYLSHHVEAQAVHVIEVAEPEEGGEGTAGQHAERQVVPDRQALPDDAAAERGGRL